MLFYINIYYIYFISEYAWNYKFLYNIYNLYIYFYFPFFKNNENNFYFSPDSNYTIIGNYIQEQKL